jgi:hypothetical protein
LFKFKKLSFLASIRQQSAPRRQQREQQQRQQPGCRRRRPTGDREPGADFSNLLFDQKVFGQMFTIDPYTLKLQTLIHTSNNYGVKSGITYITPKKLVWSSGIVSACHRGDWSYGS